MTSNEVFIRTWRRAYSRSPTSHNLSWAEQHFQESITQAKSNYESSLISFGAVSVIYCYIRSLSKTNSIPIPIPFTVYLGISAATSDESKAKLFNFYFYSVFNKES